MRKFHNKGNRGFTLVELLVVVAIIAILAAIALPQFSRYRQSAYRNAVRSDIRNAVSAVEAFVADYGVYPDQMVQGTGAGGCGGGFGPGACTLQNGTTGDQAANAVNVSRNVQLQYNFIADCGAAGGPAGSPGYEIIGIHAQIDPTQFTGRYNSCTGQYQGF